ncbi:hypothetical protein NN6n1_42660 [Shinella zoogloeoides]
MVFAVGVILARQSPKRGAPKPRERLTGRTANDHIDALIYATVALQMRHRILRLKDGNVGEAAVVTVWHKRSEIQLMRGPSMIIDLDRCNRTKARPVKAQAHAPTARKEIKRSEISALVGSPELLKH